MSVLLKTVFQSKNLDCSLVYLGVVTLIVYIAVLKNSGLFVGLNRFLFVDMYDGIFFCECVYLLSDMWFFEPKYMGTENTSNLSDKLFLNIL